MRETGKNRILGRRVFFSVAWVLLSLAAASSLQGCMQAYRQSVGATLDQVYSRDFITDLNSAWLSTQEALKSYTLDISNRESGYVQTRWKENTAEKNLVDSFGASDAYLKAQYRVKVNVSKRFYNGKPSVRVTIQKEQLVQRDVLEGWVPVESDGVDERSFLYRVGRLIYMKTKLTQIEEARIEAEIQARKKSEAEERGTPPSSDR